MPARRLRLIAGFLLLCMTTGSAQVVTRPAPEAMKALADRAKRRDKAAERQMKQWVSLRQEFGGRRMKAYRDGRSDLEESFHRTSQVYEQARITTEHERGFLRDLLFAEQHPANQPLPNVTALMGWAMPLPVPFNTPEIEAIRRHYTAQRSGKDKLLIKALDEEVQAHRDLALALGHVRLSLNDYSSVRGMVSVEQRYEQRLAARHRQRAAAAARASREERENALAAAWLLGLLAAGVVAAALTAGTPEGRARAKADLDRWNQYVATTCFSPDIHMFPGPDGLPAAYCIPGR
jgi:hypothetical protein